MVAEAVESPRRLLYPVLKYVQREEALEMKHALANDCAVARKHVLVLAKALACCCALLLRSARGDSSDNFPLLSLLLWLSVLMERSAIIATLEMQYVSLAEFAAGSIASVPILSSFKDALMMLLDTTTAEVSKLAEGLREASRDSQTSRMVKALPCLIKHRSKSQGLVRASSS